MKAAIRHLMLLGFFGISIFSCKEKTEDPKVFVSPGETYLYGKAGDTIEFSIKVEAAKALARFYITAKPDNGVTQTIFDTSPLTKTYNQVFLKAIESGEAGQSIVMTFSAVDEDGNLGQHAKRLIVEADTAETLDEYAGQKMKSQKAGVGDDAYNLETNQAVTSSIDPATDRDIQDSVINAANDTISRTWISPSGGLFVLFIGGSGFDYANATDVSAKQAYDNGIKKSFLTGLQADDVIITKLVNSSTADYVVIRLTDIVDPPGNDFDEYEFSIKKK